MELLYLKKGHCQQIKLRRRSRRAEGMGGRRGTCPLPLLFMTVPEQPAGRVCQSVSSGRPPVRFPSPSPPCRSFQRCRFARRRSTRASKQTRPSRRIASIFSPSGSKLSWRRSRNRQQGKRKPSVESGLTVFPYGMKIIRCLLWRISDISLIISRNVIENTIWEKTERRAGET
jgi:hypothetical protein